MPFLGGPCYTMLLLGGILRGLLSTSHSRVLHDLERCGPPHQVINHTLPAAALEVFVADVKAAFTVLPHCQKREAHTPGQGRHKGQVGTSKHECLPKTGWDGHSHIPNLQAPLSPCCR